MCDVRMCEKMFFHKGRINRAPKMLIGKIDFPGSLAKKNLNISVSFHEEQGLFSLEECWATKTRSSISISPLL